MTGLCPNLRSHVPEAYQSPWYKWFVDMQYPNLDILKEGCSWWRDCEESGIWHIIEFYRSPVIPALTKWNYVLMDIKNVEISRSFVEKFVDKLDLRKKQVWDDAEAKSKRLAEEDARLERHREETAQRALDIIKATPTVMDRIHRNGLHEMAPHNIWKHVPRHQKIGARKIAKRGYSR